MGRTQRLAGRANVAGWLCVLLVVCLAEVGVRAFDLDDTVAAPSDALRALVAELRSGALSGELGTTLESYALGFAFAIVLGVTLGVAIGSSRLFDAGTSVVLEVLRPIPAVALIPLAILSFGLGTPAVRFVVAYAAVWPILVNTIYGVRSRDAVLDDVAGTSGVTGFGKVVRVTLPAALPSIVTGIRLSASIALAVGVTAELVIGAEGIGAYMQQQRLGFRIPELYAAVVLVGLLGLAINVVLRAVERRAVFWVGEERLERR